VNCFRFAFIAPRGLTVQLNEPKVCGATGAVPRERRLAPYEELRAEASG